MTSLFAKARNRALGILERRGPSIEAVCAAKEVLCPAEDPETLPGICEERDFERVTACEKTTTLEEERARMRGGKRRHGATVLYRLEDVALRDGWLSSKKWRTFTAQHPSPWRGGQPAELETAAYAATFVGSFYFGHWLSDDLPLMLEAGRHAPPVTTARTPFLHEPGYLDLLGLTAQPLIRAHFHQLLWIDNVAQNSYRAQQYRELRRRIRHATAPVEGRKVMLHRGRSGVERVLVNEEEVESLLEKRGFEIIDAMKLSVREIAQACAGARIALGVEGSQLTHAFFAMADHGAIVTIVPAFRYINHYKDLTDCVGIRYGSIIGDAAEGGYRVNPDELLHLLDRVETALETGR